MSNITNFKSFVKENPSLLKYVQKGEMTWQKFYEMYDMYGESNDVWNEYLNKEVNTATSSFDFVNWVKNIDMNALQENINSVNRVIGVIQDLGLKDDNAKTDYKPRPLYKHFED